MSVVSKTAATNAVSPYFVSSLAGPRLFGRRVEKGEELRLSEHQARALLLTGEIVSDKDVVDDPFGEVARKAEAAKAAAAAEAAADKEAADAKAVADKAVADAKAVADKAIADAKAAKPKASDTPLPPAAG